jgi:hypothetical protein
MDDRLHEFGDVPGYEFDAPRAAGQPRPVAGGGERARQPWPPPPESWAWQQRPVHPWPQQPREPWPQQWQQPWPEQPQQPWPQQRQEPRPQQPRQPWPQQRQQPWPEQPREPRPLLPEEDPPAGPGRLAVLTRDTLAAMRARNWLTSLAAPLVAAIAVGVAGVVVLGANNGGNTGAPSALAAGFPPARSAVADFGGGDGRPVEVSAIAAAGPTEVAVGSANRGGALWVSADGGSTWRRAALTQAIAGAAANGQLAGVAHGPSGWLAVGGASASPASLAPAVIGSPDGLTWTAVGSPAAFGGAGQTVTAAVAAGPGGYVIVGKASAGSRTVAAAWYAPGLTGWRRAADARPGALDGPGDRAMNAVTATGRGFAAVGAVGPRPAAWVSGTGGAWTLVTLPLPAGAASAALDYVAANGGVLAAVGTEVTAAGQHRPFAAVSTDGGTAWTQSRLPLPAGAAEASATALTAAGGGFTATGTYGSPGETDVVVWTLPGAAAGGTAGTGWTEAAPQGTGLAGPGMQAITALTATGATLTGAGFTTTPAAPAKAAKAAAASASMQTEPTIWQSPVRS